MNGELSQKRFAFGVTALTLSVIAVKVIGLIYKIPLLKILGAEGMGYFNAAYELYALFFVISTAGLPVAVSILISESLAAGRGRNMERIHKISFAIFCLLGIVGSLLMGFGASAFSGLLESPKAELAILAISPTVFFVCISGAMRGYFQGGQNMQPTAISQVIEAVGKLVLGLLFAVFAKRAGNDASVCAAYAALGLTAGSLLSMLYLLLTKHFSRFVCPSTALLTDTDPPKTILKRLLLLAVPVTLSSSLSGLTRVIDMSMILRRLQTTGYESSVAAAMYGCYSTLAVPVYNIPSSLVAGISLSLVPILTAVAERGDREKGSELVISSLKMCLFLSVPCSVGMAMFAKPILSLLFVGEEGSVAVAAPLLTVLAFSVCSSCLMGITNAVLQAYRKAMLPIFSMLVGTAVKILSAYILTGIPEIGMQGAAISTLLCNTASVGMNLYFIDRHTGAQFHILKLSIPPMMASFLSVGISFAVWCLLARRLSSGLGLLVSILLCILLYLWIGGKMGVYREREVRMLPYGDKLAGLLLALGLIKKEKRKDIEHEQRGYHQRASFQKQI